MSLSISFNGNIVDSNEDAINCRYKGYHVEQDEWSDWYDSSNEYYSLDLGDSSWLTQYGSVNNPGDNIVIIFETLEEDPLDRQFGILKLQLNSDDTYIIDVQLRACYAPTIDSMWGLSSAVDGATTFVNADDNDTVTYIGRVNTDESIVESFTDEKSWDYNGTTMWHKIMVGSTDVFGDRVGIDTKEYDWTEDDAFVTDTVHQYDAISQTDEDKAQEVEAKVTNLKGQVVTSIKKLQIRYNTPVADITWSPTVPSILDTFTVTGANTDIDSRVIAISYKYDGTEVDNNTELDYEWTQDLGDTYVVEGHTVNTDVSWNDGFNDFTIAHQEHFSMTNLAPSFTLTKEVVGEEEDNDIKFTLSDLIDPDGDDTKLEARWVIEYKVPFSNDWIVVQDAGYPAEADLDPKEWIFETAGDYRISTYVKDEHGLEATQNVEVTFASGSSCDGSGKIKLNTEDGKVRWQLISIPVKNKKIKEYFVDWLDSKIKEYDDTKDVTDVLERVTAYPGQLGKALTFVPGSTPEGAEGNFSMVMEDGTNVNEILGFWCAIKDYKSITDGEDLVFEWAQADSEA